MLYLLFQIGQEHYALEARQAIEVIPFVALQRIPGAPSGVAGVFNYRGQGVTALDLCKLTTGRPAREQFSTRIILVNCDECRVTGKGAASTTPPVTRHPRLLGLIVERATGLLRREECDFQDADALASAKPAGQLGKATAPWLGPVLMDGERVIQLLQPSRFSGVAEETP